MGVHEDYMKTMNRVCKWRTILASRVWGTQLKTPQANGRTDIFEKLILLRIETTALFKLLYDKGIITLDEYKKACIEEADALDMAYAAEFPGIRALNHGLEFYDPQKAAKTMEGWPP